jgi:hypothetical protein
MNRRLLLLTLFAGMGLVGNCVVIDDKDKESLQGEWMAKKNGVTFRCTFGQTFTFSALGPPDVNFTGENLGYELKADGKNKFIELDHRGADVSGIINILPYRLEGDVLQITITEGNLQGKWNLERVKKKPGSPCPE